MMDTALKQDSLNTTDILELESLTIDGLNFIFPKSSHALYTYLLGTIGLMKIAIIY